MNYKESLLEFEKQNEDSLLDDIKKLKEKLDLEVIDEEIYKKRVREAKEDHLLAFKKKEEEYKDDEYKAGIDFVKEREIDKAKEIFEDLKGYKDADKYLEICSFLSVKISQFKKELLVKQIKEEPKEEEVACTKGPEPIPNPVKKEEDTVKEPEPILAPADEEESVEEAVFPVFEEEHEPETAHESEKQEFTKVVKEKKQITEKQKMLSRIFFGLATGSFIGGTLILLIQFIVANVHCLYNNESIYIGMIIASLLLLVAPAVALIIVRRKYDFKEIIQVVSSYSGSGILIFLLNALTMSEESIFFVDWYYYELPCFFGWVHIVAIFIPIALAIAGFIVIKAKTIKMRVITLIPLCLSVALNGVLIGRMVEDSGFDNPLFEIGNRAKVANAPYYGEWVTKEIDLYFHHCSLINYPDHRNEYATYKFDYDRDVLADGFSIRLRISYYEHNYYGTTQIVFIPDEGYEFNEEAREKVNDSLNNYCPGSTFSVLQSDNGERLQVLYINYQNMSAGEISKIDIYPLAIQSNEEI